MFRSYNRLLFFDICAGDSFNVLHNLPGPTGTVNSSSYLPGFPIYKNFNISSHNNSFYVGSKQGTVYVKELLDFPVQT